MIIWTTFLVRFGYSDDLKIDPEVLVPPVIPPQGNWQEILRISVYWFCSQRGFGSPFHGRNGGGGARGARSLLHFTKAKGMSLNRGATHFTLGLRPCIISHPSYYKYTCAPLSKLPSCAPDQDTAHLLTTSIWWHYLVGIIWFSAKKKVRLKPMGPSYAPSWDTGCSLNIVFFRRF